jgi:phage gp29-like protein
MVSGLLKAPRLSNLPIQLVDTSINDEEATYKGAKLTTSYVKTVLQSADAGERDVYVDALCELLEGDAHTSGVLRSIYGEIAGLDATIQAAHVDESTGLQEQADAISDATSIVLRTPGWRAMIYGLLWGHFFGASCREVVWRRTESAWTPDRFGYIHSRRIDYVDNFKPVLRLSNVYTSSLEFEDFPAKFVLFEPSVTGDYRTREGVGRDVIYWMAFKRFGVRELLGYMERFGKPFPVASWSTSDNGNPRPADSSEITTAKSLVKDIGRGTQPGAALPDSIQLELVNSLGDTAKTDTIHTTLIELCNTEINKALLSSTLTTDVGDSGSRALGSVHEQIRATIVNNLVKQLDECVTNQLVYWFVLLNFGEFAAKNLCPRYVTVSNDNRDRLELSEQLERLISIGLPVSIADVRETFGWREPADENDTLGPPPPKPVVVPAQTPEPSPQED